MLRADPVLVLLFTPSAEIGMYVCECYYDSAVFYGILVLRTIVIFTQQHIRIFLLFHTLLITYLDPNTWISTHS